ncbi:hypothetical protein KIN20_012176 [Parelaphostrongylus tenuis]|uniref:Protein arginine N-methyltransferase domain-containing protein n=1 Tax=Parelaphostrongylus tenuis TaxID=148309 RepID=A0AAD5MAI4_PARTN|nr:hypothetical protein KIN20_012176 [Parelaphostrongylus tenuis]
MFLERFNHVTGEREWEVAEEDRDLAQEIARSRFADMILDQNRNDMFLEGLRSVIQEKKDEDVPPHVFDIGAGTGLLSLMAAREGATQVTAVEVFQPMAECARVITQSSQWKDKINVIPSRSTELSPLSSKPNIIVAEVFDTELIGEGALRTFKEALINHVEPGCRVVPSRARVWVLPVESTFLSKFNQIPRLSKVLIYILILVGQLNITFSFNFECSDSIVYDESFDRTAICLESGQVDAIMMWWDLDMDGKGTYWIDMAPKWANSNYHWRDHWMQAVYYLTKRAQVKKGETLSLKCCHDEFSMWFSVGEESFDRVYCNCHLHTIMSRQSIFSANALLDNAAFRDEVRSICEGRRVVVVGEGSFLFLLVAPIASSVTVVDSNPHFRELIGKYVSFYKFQNLVVVEKIADVSNEPDVVIGEPFYLSAMTPWQNLRFWYDVTALQSHFGKIIEIHPQSAILYGMCEQFDNLQKTAAPVGTVNGFDLSAFDDLSQKARQATDALVDIHPLWEYGGVATSEPFEVLRFDLRQEPHDVEGNLKILLKPGTNGIPLWIEWQFGNFTISTGLKQPVRTGDVPQWKEGVKQGVYLLSPKLLDNFMINVDAEFARGAGEVYLQFY